MARTAKQVDARERARQARLRVDAERERRDRKIEEAAADYFNAADDYAEIASELHRVENRMSTAVKALLNLGESQARIAALLGLDTKEVRRLRGGADQQTGTTDHSSDQARPRAPDQQGTDTPTAVHTTPALAGTSV